MQKMLNKQSKKSCLLPRLNDYQQVREKFEL